MQDMQRANIGWVSDIETFCQTPLPEILASLGNFIPDAGHQQITAWETSLSILKKECISLVELFDDSKKFHILIEYEIPRESRRPDIVILGYGVVLVLELKGYPKPSQAFIDQAFAYGRDLQFYHGECEGKEVIPLLVMVGADFTCDEQDGVIISPIKNIYRLLYEKLKVENGPLFNINKFLSNDAYRPLPTLIRAARALFQHEPLPTIKRASAATDPAIEVISAIAHSAARTKTRHLVLLNGVPGAGKTLVGLRAVHAGYLDDLAVPRSDGKKTIPAVFLSGNGPLVEVLQHTLRTLGGGKTFVRGVKDYIKAYSKSTLIPPEHLLVSDEAQRAWDSDQVAAKHKGPNKPTNKSEPELFIEFAERIPEWCVFVGLIGGGQEIHIGEEGGIVQWSKAIANCANPSNWTVHASKEILNEFSDSSFSLNGNPALSLDTEIRYHLTPKVHEYVKSILSDANSKKSVAIAEELTAGGFRFMITRSLEAAKLYIQNRYEDSPEARYGILASAKDKDLEGFGVDNSWFRTSKLKVGPWYNDPQNSPLSCCQLQAVATEFSSQGLELDYTLIAWGTDFAYRNGEWSNERSRGTRGNVKNPFQLRLNVYRVLMTRGREGAVIFLPKLSYLDPTYDYFLKCGMQELDEEGLATSSDRRKVENGTT
jgi:DUF2075 family protein|tara:strand:+ start:131 stop:2098 length:1968 start_codon:yes stop_codon:yes gene_type:complete